MAALDFEIDISGWENAFKGARRRLGNLNPAHRAIGPILVEMTRQNFDTSGGNGPTWPSLAESTLIARAENPSGKADISAAGGGAYRVFNKSGKVSKVAARVMAAAKPLIWSKKLYRSIRFVIGSDYVDVGTDIMYARRLFFGWNGHPRTPARFPFRFRVGDAARIAAIYARHIFGGLK
jgi:phage gpG-like protein